MYGAFGLKPGTVNGEILLNLDSEDEGELYIGCAGGMDYSDYFRCLLVNDKAAKPYTPNKTTKKV